MTFGQQLKYLRGAREVSQRQLAELLLMDPAYLSRIESDAPNHTPGNETIGRIIKVLELQQKDADALFVAAKRLPPDILTKLLERPRLFSRIRRA